MAVTNQAPLTKAVEKYVPPITTAGNSATPMFHIVDLGATGATGVVTAVQYAADAALNGANTNSRTLTLFNRTFGGAGGTGTTKVAELALVSGVNLAQATPTTITLQAAANLVVTHGDRLQWSSAAVSSGITDPGGMVKVTYTRD